MFHFLLHITGGDNGSGPWYLELSGFVGLLSFIGAFWAWYKNSRCHVGGRGLKGCRRHATYPFQHYKLCHKHHPKVPANGATHHHIMQLHKETEYER